MNAAANAIVERVASELRPNEFSIKVGAPHSAQAHGESYESEEKDDRR